MTLMNGLMYQGKAYLWVDTAIWDTATGERIGTGSMKCATAREQGREAEGEARASSSLSIWWCRSLSATTRVACTAAACSAARCSRLAMRACWLTCFARARLVAWLLAGHGSARG